MSESPTEGHTMHDAWEFDHLHWIWAAALALTIALLSLVLPGLRTEAVTLGLSAAGSIIVSGLFAVVLGGTLCWGLAKAISFVLEIAYVFRAPDRIAALMPLITTNRVDSSTHGTVLWRAAERTHRTFVVPGVTSIIAHNRLLRSVLDDQQQTSPIPLLSSMTSKWLGSEDSLRPLLERRPRFTDPIHGAIEFPESFYPLIQHPLVQRLNEVRQLVFAFPAFPGGTHTRFSHSIGVAHLAAVAMRRVLEHGWVYSSEGRRPLESDERVEAEHWVTRVTAAGLVHDVAHTPLGHSLDRFFGTRFFHGASSADKTLLPGLLRSHLRESLELVEHTTVDHVLRVLEADQQMELTGWEVFASELLDSALDVDRMDYLLRDAHFTGLRDGAFNLQAVLHAIRPFQDESGIHLAFDE